MAAALLAVHAACGGPLTERSHAETAGEIPVGQGITKIRIEIENGTIGVKSAAGRAVAFAGGIRRAADTAAELSLLEQVAPALVGAVDPGDPTLLVVRGPTRPAAVPSAVMAMELGVHAPADIPLEIVVGSNGHVTIADRAAATYVETGRGDLRFENCAGGVTAKTGRGVVILFGHRGNIDVQTKVGDMQAFVEEPDTLIQLVTGQGTVQCQVAPSIEFDLDARAETGKIGNGFDLVAEQQGYRAVLTGRRGSARTKVVLRTGYGHLSIAPLRAK